MMPRILAAADQIMLDSVNLKYFAESMPADAIDRVIVPLGWTVRETIAQLVVANERFASDVQRALRALTFTGEAGEDDELNAEAVAEAVSTPFRALLARLESSSASLIAAYKSFPDHLNLPRGEAERFQELLSEDSGHMRLHAIDLVDAVPELRMDPMVLNWVLHVDYAGDERRTAAQLALLREVRDAILANEHEMESADGA